MYKNPQKKKNRNFPRGKRLQGSESTESNDPGPPRLPLEGRRRNVVFCWRLQSVSLTSRKTAIMVRFLEGIFDDTKSPGTCMVTQKITMISRMGKGNLYKTGAIFGPFFTLQNKAPFSWKKSVQRYHMIQQRFGILPKYG